MYIIIIFFLKLLILFIGAKLTWTNNEQLYFI